MFCIFSRIIYTLCIFLHFLLVQHYILEIYIYVDTHSSGSLILHCCVVFHLQFISHLPVDGLWDHLQSFPIINSTAVKFPSDFLAHV